MEIIKELYYGNIEPFEKDSECAEDLKKLIQAYETICQKLSEEDQEALNKYIELNSELADKTECKMFVQGFCLGAKFMLEILEK